MSGWAGCRLWGAGFFDGVEPDGQTPMPVPFAVGKARIRADESVQVWRDRIDASEIVTRYGVPCADELRSLFDSMRRRRDLREAVVAMDMMAAAELVSVRRLDDYRRTRHHWRGATLVAHALLLASEYSRSPNETRMRLIWVLDAALPRPLVNRPVFDLTGRLLAVADLLDLEAGVVGEFDGADHRAAHQHSSDIAREDRLRKHGLEVFHVSGPDLSHVDRVVSRMRAARARARWQPARERRWTDVPPPWREAGPSLDEALARRDLIREIHLVEERERAHSSRSAAPNGAGTGRS